MALSACNTETDSAGRELTAHGTAAFPIACYHDDLEAAPVPWHWHEELELLIASEGGVLAAAAGEKYTLAEGDGLFINAGVLHADWPLTAGRCRLHSVVFHPRLVGGSPDSVFWQKYLQPLLTDPSRPCAVLRRSVDWQREAIDCMERAFRAVVNEIPGYEFKTRAALSDGKPLADAVTKGQHEYRPCVPYPKRRCAAPTALKRCCNLCRPTTPRT